MKNICFQMTRKAWLAIVMVLCLSFPALAQKTTVTGTVVDTEGEPLIGASVLAQGTSTGVATDIDGNFRLDVAPNAVLVVTYVGYDTQTIPVNGRSHIDVVMSENSHVLGEVVAIGYGVVKKSDATGSVSVIKPDDIEAGISTSTQDLLVGASPGVVVTQDGGDPTGNATIRIRGGASLSASNDPLIVIDGVPQNNMSNGTGANALTMINPQNIESITVLKDASATAIYGSRASNGVIIVTTKGGQAGKPQVTFAANFHVATARNTLNLMNASQFKSAMQQYAGDNETILSQLGDADTNWQDEVLRTVFSHDYNLSVAGQAGWLPYRVSASYTNNQGILKSSDMQRTTVGFNLSPKFFNGKLSVNANVQGSYIRVNDTNTGAVYAAADFNPTLPVYTDYPTTGTVGKSIYNGYTNVLSGANPDQNATQNPLQLLQDRKQIGKTYSSSGNLQLDYALHFLPELHFNLNLGYSVSKNDRTTDVAANSVQAWRNGDLDTNGTPGAATQNNWYELQRNTLLDFYINYRKEFDAIKSNVDVMVGYSWQKMDYHGRSQTYLNSLGISKTYVDGVYNLDWMEDTADKVGQPLNNAPQSVWAAANQLVSFFGRLNYSFKDTYLLTFTLRDDATSRFSKDTRWGLFPALALGWKINNMAFMEGTQEWLNDMKLRLGWGVTGQQDVGSYFPYLATYTSSYTNGFLYPSPDGNGWINPLYPNAYDSKIKWEETTTWNVGLDFGFLNNRVTFAADWYLRNTKDLLARAPSVGLNTTNYVTRNIGSLRNTGIELTLGARPVVTKDFTWSTNVNVAWNKNKITSLTGDAETSQIAADGRGLPTGTGGNLQWYLVGEPANTFRVYQQVYDSNGDPINGQYVDQNGDGTIDDNDLIMYHSADPTWTATWNNTFNYKGWDLGITLRANFGNYVYNAPKYNFSHIGTNYGLHNLLNDTYIFSSVNEQLPLSDYFVENASFVRCDNITLGYTFDNLLNDKLKLRLYGAVQNPFVITKYTGLDPENYSGIDNNTYPRPITFTLGVVATF
jgi:iron complex outermembrane receptor protein